MQRTKKSTKLASSGKKVRELEKQVRSDVEVAKIASKNEETLLRKGKGGKNIRLLKFTPMTALPMGKNIVVAKIKGIQPPKPKKAIEHFSIAACRCVELMHLIYGKRKVRVLPGKDTRNVREGNGSGRRFYDIQVVPVK